MGAVAFDTETSGVDLRHSSRPFLVTIFDPDSCPEPLFWQWDVDPLTREVLFSPEDLREIQEILENSDRIVGHNLKFDITAMQATSCKWRRSWWNKIDDTIYSAHLLATGSKKDLTSQALIYLGIDIEPYEKELEKAVKACRQLARTKKFQEQYGKWMIAEEGLPGLPSSKGKEIWRNDYWLPRAVAKATKLPKNHKYWTVLSDYAVVDSQVTLKLHEVHQKAIAKRKLTRMYQERIKLIRPIFLMESRGITYSTKRMYSTMDKFAKEAKELEAKFVGMSEGIVKSLPKNGTTNAMRQLLFKRWKLPVVARSEKTNEPTVDSDALKHYLLVLPKDSKQHKAISVLSGYRSRMTAIGYMSGYKRYSKPFKNSKEYRVLHPSVNPAALRTLRFSHSNPNESNISGKEEANIRKEFGPAEGREWWSADFHNLELRLPAYKVNESSMIELFEKPNDPPYFGSYHFLNASIIYEKEYYDCLNSGGDPFNVKYKPTLYTYTKQFGFAIQYGAQQETADAAARKPGSYAKMQARLHKITTFSDECVQHAIKHGYVNTFHDNRLGCSYPIQVQRTKGRVKPTQPFSYVIQSTGMHVMWVSMIRVQEYLDKLNAKLPYPQYFMIVQIHDELVFDFPKPKTPCGNLRHILKIRDIMEKSGDDIGIPLKVDYKWHPDTWGKAAEIPEELLIGV